MKAPVLFTVIALIVVGALLLWDHASSDDLAVTAATPAPEPPRSTCTVRSDDDLEQLKEPPAIEVLVIEASEGEALGGPRAAELNSAPSYLGDAIDLVQARKQLEQSIGIKRKSAETSRLTAKGLVVLGRFHGLRRLEINDVATSDTLVDELLKARQIEALILSNTGITTGQILKLSACANIRELGLRQAVLDSKALSAIGTMTQLVRLDLAASLFDDGDLNSLQSLPHLAFLNLAGTAAMSEGVTALGQLDGLRELNLAATNVGNAAIVHVARMRNLEVLRIPATHVRPTCLSQLKELKQIRVLELPDTFGTLPMIELRRALPKTLVYNTVRNGI
jgi:hypothetical protein